VASKTEWLEVSVTVENETAEAVAEVLSRYVQRGVVIEAGPHGWNTGPVIVRAYLPVDDEMETRKRNVKEGLGHLSQIRPVSKPVFRRIAEKDWTEVWKDRLTVLHIGQHIVIRPTWLNYAPASEDIVIQLDPGMAFGTGLHPTTQMCLEALEELVRPDSKVLDIGTGSGILAIAAAKLGAGSVVAADNDRAAVKTARENMTANRVSDSVRVVKGSLAEISESHDLVVVNILAKVIIEMIQEGLATRVCPGGILVAAGIITEQEKQVLAAMEQQGLVLARKKQRDDWVCLIAERR
jgi:ribosomal protein L11 methyltransferase